MINLAQSHNEATALIIDHIQDVEASIQLTHALDSRLLTLMKERLTETFDGENDWWLDTALDFSDLTFAPYNPINWYPEDSEMEYDAWFGLYIDGEEPHKMLARFEEGESFSLVSRLVQRSAEAGSGFALWFNIHSAYKKPKKDYDRFIAERASKITQTTGFQLYDNGNFYLPFSVDSKLLADAIRNDDFSECLKPFDDAIAKVKDAVPVFTALIKEVEQQFGVSILPV